MMPVTRFFTTGFIAILMFGMAAATQASPMLGVNFAANRNDASTQIQPSDTLGAPGFEQSNWNRALNTNTNPNTTIEGQSVYAMHDQAGNFAGTLDWDGETNYFMNPRDTPDGAMMRTYIEADTDETDGGDPAPNGMQVNVADLTEPFTTQGYQIVIYFNIPDSNADNYGDRVINVDYGTDSVIDVTVNFTTEGDTFVDNTYIQDVNYFVIDDPASIDSDNFQVNILGAVGEPSSEKGAIVGMQVVAVPEPGSLGLVSIGLLLMGVRPLHRARQ